MKLVEENVALANARKALEEERVVAYSRNTLRRAEFDAFLKGFEEGALVYEQCAQRNAVQQDALGAAQAAYGQLAQAVDEKPVEDEAIKLRLHQLLDYMGAYREFRTVADDLEHKRGLRVATLQRMGRALQVQIDEAPLSLDPNVFRYKQELADVDAEAKAKEAERDDMARRIDLQKERWQPFEEELREDGVDLGLPPNHEAEMHRVTRRSRALDAARTFASKEQEVVDRDAMQLRRLRIQTAASLKQIEASRANTPAAGATRPTIAAAPESPIAANGVAPAEAASPSTAV
jgi:hypothetical protein